MLLITQGFFAMAYENGHADEPFHYVEVNIIKVMEALFLSAAVLISYGAIIGKVNPLQLVMMTLLETIFYSINKACLLFGVVSMVDAGGTINIHMFGCYFGLAVSYMIGIPPATEDSEGGHVADLFSLIGTIFLWIYWPSFNGGALEPDSEPQQRAVVNTILALSACTVTTFWVSCILSTNWKFRPVDLQNATLSGGVAIGAVCHMTLNTADSLLIGAAAGLCSTVGFARLQAILEKNGLHDTCGVNNLHGIPSILGGVASVILAAYKGPMGHDYPEVMPHKNQWQGNLFSILLTLAVSIVTGLFTGYIMKQFSYDTTFYSDSPYWEVMDDFGRSQEDHMKQHLTDLEAGLEASRSLRDIIAKYSSLGGKGFEDSSTHSQNENKKNNKSSV
jgi:ammonium transporter Rh